MAAAPVAAAAGLWSPFTVSQAVIREAKRTPRPESGSEVLLYANSSTATITVSGSGRVVLALAGSACGGVMPIVAADIDGVRAGTVQVVNQSTYHITPVGTAVAAGTHIVTVRMTNDYVDATCDRNAVVSAASMEFPGSAAMPGSANTGAPKETNLPVYQGNLVITQAGTVIDGWDIRGRVQVKANDVTIRNSVIRGGARLQEYGALIESWWGFKNLRVTDSTLRAANPGLYVDGISGANFTAERLDISAVVDQVKVIGPNVTVRNSWLHDNFHSDNNPNQPDGVTHDDNVQIEGGAGIVVERNVLSGSYNAAVMITQNHSTTANVRISDNWLAGGACTINVDEKGKGAIRGSVIERNRFGTGRYGATCPMRLPSSSPIGVTANVWQATGAVASPNRY